MKEMSETVDTAPATAAKIPITLNAADALSEICRGMGIVPLSKDEAANLPPWTEQEAAAFKRTINETFEQIEEAPKVP